MLAVLEFPMIPVIFQKVYIETQVCLSLLKSLKTGRQCPCFFLLLCGPPALAPSSWFWFLPQTFPEPLVGHEKIAEEMDEDKTVKTVRSRFWDHMDPPTVF